MVVGEVVQELLPTAAVSIRKSAVPLITAETEPAEVSSSWMGVMPADELRPGRATWVQLAPPFWVA